MEKVNDQPMEEQKLNDKEVEKISGGEEQEYEEPEVTKVELDEKDRDTKSRCKGPMAFEPIDSRCYF